MTFFFLYAIGLSSPNKLCTETYHHPVYITFPEESCQVSSRFGKTESRGIAVNLHLPAIRRGTIIKEKLIRP
jgi:hypothetical protein